MNDTAIKNFCLEARAMLEEQVQQCAVKYGIVEQGAPAPDAVSVGEVALTELQRSQRAQLLELQSALGHDELVRRAAYTWFNRLVAIRFMEVNGYLPSGVRMLSAPDGSFGSQAVSEALHVQIAGIDQAKVVDLAQSGDDEPLFRYLFLLQCQELAECLPSVFEQVGSAFELLLPEGLSRKGSVADLLVTCLPETDEEGSPTGTWQDVEILGWMYQFYNAQVKDEFFKSKRKASAADLAPATQLFTPKWIVRYMVENSLGRLWMLDHPDSNLRQHMDYYIEPDAQHEDFLRVESPEEITFCDPACGSGHILSYAFELLFHMYEEAGYRTREIPALILSKNLSGMEIDRRAAQIASLVLALRARQHDRRFFGRGVQADVCVLETIPFEEGELACCGKPLAEALTHLGEVGSLLAPTEEDLTSLRTELATCEGDLFAHAKAEKLKLAIEKCEKLSRRFDVVVANPPYMGSSSFNPFMSKWAKKNYPDTNKDLCTCFIERGYVLAKERGYSAMVTMQSWMFLGSFEKMRASLLAQKGIVTMAHLGSRAFDAIGGEVVSVTADVLYNSAFTGRGAYFRLVDINGSEPKRQALLEAIKNPDCGYFYRADATTFKTIPGSPIAYVVSSALSDVFANSMQLREVIETKQGLATGGDADFVRCFWEVAFDKCSFNCPSAKVAVEGSSKWFPLNKGGEYKKWYGNNELLISYDFDSRNKLKERGNHLPSERYYFRPQVTWSKVTAGQIAFRYKPMGHVFGVAGGGIFGDDNELLYVQGLCNSSVIGLIAGILSPTLNYEVGQIASYPYRASADRDYRLIQKLVSQLRHDSRQDYDSFEISWDFKRHPLL